MSRFDMWRIGMVAGALTWAATIGGCATPDKTHRAPASQSAPAQPSRLFQASELPRQIGVVENCGLQIPAISPDGRQMLYLRSQGPRPSMAMLLGGDPPTEGSLSIWVRPIRGALAGKPLSTQQWAHSPAWSQDGTAVAYVAHDDRGSAIVHVDMHTGRQTSMGLPQGAHCLPRFDTDSRTVLFCRAKSVDAPFRVYRQILDETEPVPMSPEGMECILPLRTGQGGAVLCAKVDADQLHWVWANPTGTQAIGAAWGGSGRMEALQAWAGVSQPISADGTAVLFYDSGRDRMSVLHLNERVLRQHRPASIAGCWVDAHTIVLATPAAIFLTDVATGQSVQLLSGTWIPGQFTPADSRLILLGRESQSSFAVWEIVSKPTSRQVTNRTVPATSRRG